MTRKSPSDPANAEVTLLTGVGGLVLGTAALAFAVHFAIEEWRKHGEFGSDAVVGLGIAAGTGLMLLLCGGTITYAGWRDREKASAIRAATALDPQSLPAATSPWRPAPAVTDHLGRPLAPDLDFFAAPPPEIGPVFTAASSLRTGVIPRPTWVVTFEALSAGAAGFAAGWALLRLAEPKYPSAWWLGGGFVGTLGFLIGWGRSRYRHACSYVGRDGVARFVARNRRDPAAEAGMFLFRDAADLYFDVTDRYENSVYRGTDFRFDWVDADGEIQFQIAGRYLRTFTGHNPWVDVPYQWGLAAEAAWGKHIDGRLRGELARDGAATFRASDGRQLRIGPGFVELVDGGRVIRAGTGDASAIRLSGGAFHFTGRVPGDDAAPPTSVRIPASMVANLAAFAKLAYDLAGLRIGR